jgi:hypothetical protein
MMVMIGAIGSVLLADVVCVIEAGTGGKGRCRRDDGSHSVGQDHYQAA